MPVRELLRESWRRYRQQFQLLIMVVLAPVLANAIGLILKKSPFESVRGIGSLASFVSVVLWLFAIGALLYALDRRGHQVGELYRKAAPKVLPILWAGILVSLVNLGGFFMLIVPGIIFMVWFSFTSYVVILEDHRGIDALLKSRFYVRGAWWGILGRIVLVVMLLMIASMIGAFAAIPFGPIGGDLFAAILQALFVTFYATYEFTLYQDIKRARTHHTYVPHGRGFFIFSAFFGIVMMLVLIVVGIVFSAILLRSFIRENPEFLDRIRNEFNRGMGDSSLMRQERDQGVY